MNNHGYKALKIHGRHIDEHRAIVEKHIGRKLKSFEIIHHLDMNKMNNSIDNLVILNRSEHAKLHMKGHVVSDDTKHKLSVSLRDNRSLTNMPKSVLCIHPDGTTSIFSNTRDLKKCGFRSDNVRKICRGTRPSGLHGGCKWMFYDPDFDSDLDYNLFIEDENECL